MGELENLLQEAKRTLQSGQELGGRAEGVVQGHQPGAGAGGKGSRQGSVAPCARPSHQRLKWVGSAHLISLGNP